MNKSIPYKWELVIWLFIAFFFNQADRQIFNVLLLDIQTDLGLSSSQIGLVGTALLLVNGMLLPVAGILGDKLSKKWIIVCALLLWSTATMLTGLSAGLPALILLRSVATGGGEAFYSPSANKLISENHSESTRATAISAHQTALYIGFIISGLIATQLALYFGWRSAFFVFGACGILLAALMAWRIKPDKTQNSGEPLGKLIGGGFRAFFTSPTAWLLAIALTGYQFSGQAMYVWGPAYLQKDFHLDPTRAAFDASFYPQLASVIGVFVGARIADQSVGKYKGIRVWMLVLGLVLGAPFFFLAGEATSETIVCIALAGFGFFKGIYDSNTFASLYDVIEPRYRSMATSFILMFAYLLSCCSPWLLGELEPTIGLSGGMHLMGAVFLVASIPLFIALKFTLKRELKINA